MRRFVVVCLVCAAARLWAASGQWRVVQHVDEFGEVARSSWFAMAVDEGAEVFEDGKKVGRATVALRFEDPDCLRIGCRGYGDGAAVDFKKLGGVRFSFENGSGVVLSAGLAARCGYDDRLDQVDLVAVRAMMLASASVKVSVACGGRIYVARADTTNLREALEALGRRKGWAPERTSRVFDIQHSLADLLARTVALEMNPCAPDGSPRRWASAWAVESCLQRVGEAFPAYRDAALEEMRSVGFQDWMSRFSRLYGTDIAASKDMDDVGRVFQALGIPVSRAKQGSSAGRRKRFAVRAYGLGLASCIREASVENMMSAGLMLDSVCLLSRHHGLEVGLGRISDGGREAFEALCGGAWAWNLKPDLEIMLKAALVLNMKTAQCVSGGTYHIGNLMTYFGGRIGVDINCFVDDNAFVTIGLGDRILAPGIDILGKYEETAPCVENLVEASISIGRAF